MLAPLVLPEGLVVAAVVFPVRVHVGEEVVAVEGFEDRSDVGVLAGLVAVLGVGAVAVVWPGTKEWVLARRHTLLGDTPGAFFPLDRPGEVLADALPQAVDGPVVSWSGSGIGVPELCLQEVAPRIVEATEIGDGSLVMTAQWHVVVGTLL